MKALQLTRFGLVELIDVPEPTPAAGEVVIDVVAAGICASDLHGIDGGFLRQPPVVMGHEIAGCTSSGEVVAVDPQVSCGACPDCRVGHEQLCAQRRFVGIHRPGGFAHRVAVPERSLVPLPAGAQTYKGALAEPLAVALHAFNLADVHAEASIAVIGAGSIGLGVAICARASGMDVHLAETDPARRDRARELSVASVSDGLIGPHDVVVDAVGSTDTHRHSLAALRRGGTAVWVGNASADPSFDARELVRSEHRVIGSTAYTHREFVQAVGMIDAFPDDWVAREPLDDGVAVFTRLLAGSSDAVKVVLTP